MSGNFNGIECKSCVDNNRCEKCKRLIEGLIRNFPSIYKFCNGNVIKFVCCYEKVLILMNIWIAEKNLMKPHYQLKTFFIVI